MLCAVLVILGLALVPATAHAVGGAYVADQGNPGIVSQYVIDAAGELSALTPPNVTAGAAPFFPAVTPDGRSLYVTNNGDGSVSQFDVDPLSGALTPKTPASVTSGTFPIGLAVTPDGESTYVANSFDDDVSQYDIDSVTGALSPKTPGTVAAGDRPVGVAVTPDGKSAYVVNFKGLNDTISQYDIDPSTGALSPKTPASISTLDGPQSIAVTPDGKSAYVPTIGNAGQELALVAQFDIDPVTGTLSPKPGSPAATGARPNIVAVTPDGESAYVTNSTDDTVSQYDIDTGTGALSPKTPATVAAGGDPRGIAVTLDGKHAYVANSSDHNVSQYDVDPLTGALSPKTPATIDAGSGVAPFGIAVGPRPPGGYARPIAASPLRVSLAIAYLPCTAPTYFHGPPLTYDSCSPPAPASPNLTVGTFDANGANPNATGSVKFAVQINAPPTPNNIQIVVVTKDVRCKPAVSPCGPANSADGPDYTGELRATAAVRLTDKLNGPSQTVTGTVSDTSFPVTVPCGATAATTAGASCSVSTSANAVIPGSVQSGKRAVWELGPIQVLDGGPDGVVSTPDNSLFEAQGVFVP